MDSQLKKTYGRLVWYIINAARLLHVQNGKTEEWTCGDNGMSRNGKIELFDWEQDNVHCY